MTRGFAHVLALGLAVSVFGVGYVAAQKADSSADSLRGRVAPRDTTRDTTHVARPTRLPTVIVSGRPLHVIGNLPDVDDGVLYAGKKTEVIMIDSLRANTAQDVERQMLGRIPGANFSETEGAGFPSNGVGFRGLNPTQSVEVQTRQNGVNIAGDVYGYPETYYTPPAEALERIDVVRGAGSLAFGPQFGGVVNYRVRRGMPNTPLTVTASETGGAFGLFDSFDAVAGGAKKWTYYGFVDYRSQNGWRPNNDYRQVTGYGSTSYRASDRLTLGADFTMFRNRIHMPGGLTDSEFVTDPQQSFRARNWLASPWNVAALHADYTLSPSARLTTLVSYVASDRHLVWRNEDGGPEAMDAIDSSSNAFVPREVERERFHDWTLESRLTLEHSLFGRPSVLATGMRVGLNRMGRFEGGLGTTGSDFDMELVSGTWEKALQFSTTNSAAFGEELIHLTDRFSVSPGVRYEYLRSTARGHTDTDSAFAPITVHYPLAGVSAQYITSGSSALYGGVTQAYRPVLYESLTPFGSIARVDPALRASRGYSADLGWRATIRDALKVDAGLFYLWYGNRVGTRTAVNGAGNEFVEVANIGNSVHRGAEAYVEIDPLVLLGAPPQLGRIDLFNSFAFVDARYVSGEFRGNRVEQAPRVLERAGLTYALGAVSSTVQVSYTGASFGDASNSVEPTDDPAAGIVPAFTVLDWSGLVQVGQGYSVTFGVNNLANTRYFTKRTAEYPGPGILPGIGRSIYFGIRAHLQ